MKSRENIGAELVIVGTTDTPLLIDPDHGRYVDHVVELGDQVLGVDHAGVRGRRALDELSDIVVAAVERHGERNKIIGTEFLVQRLPDRQILPASSPGGVSDEQHLFATVI